MRRVRGRRSWRVGSGGLTRGAVVLAGLAVAATAAASEPAHAWRFDEGEGTIDGCGGRALELPGDGRGSIDLGTSIGRFGTRDLTVSLWFATRGDRFPAELLSDRGEASGGFSLRLTRDRAGGTYLVWRLAEDAQDTNLVGVRMPAEGPAGGWHHVVVRRVGADGEAFLDGRSFGVSHGEAVADLRGGRHLWLGASPMAAEYLLYFSGQVDELQIWDRALTDEEIAALPAPGCRPPIGEAKALPVPPQLRCATDDDCAWVALDCCGCAAGGASVVLGASAAAGVPGCGGVACPQVHVCDGRPRCEGGRCASGVATPR